MRRCPPGGSWRKKCGFRPARPCWCARGAGARFGSGTRPLRTGRKFASAVTAERSLTKPDRSEAAAGKGAEGAPPKGGRPASGGSKPERGQRQAEVAPGGGSKPERGQRQAEVAAGPAATKEPRIVRLRERYKRVVAPELQKRMGYTNIMRVPRVEKVVINMRVADALQDQRHLDKAVEALTLISGQRPVVTRARRSIAAFKLRAGNPIGCKVTLRGERMYEFLDKLFNISLPRIKDFKGIPTRSFDGRGGMNIGIREQLIFPEIDYDKVDKIRGMDITIVTTARTDEEARELLRSLGMPTREGA